MPFTLLQLQPASRTVLDLPTVKDYLRIDSTATDQDNVLTSLIKAVEGETERYLRRSLLPQQWKLLMDRFPGSWPYTYGYGMVQSPRREIHIPIVPLISIDNFTYQDPQTLAANPVTNYQLVPGGSNNVARLQPQYGTAWPIAAWTIGGIQITFTSGHQDTQASPVVGTYPLPEAIPVAMKIWIGFLYENRESQEMPIGVESLLRAYRVFDVAPVANNWGRFAR